MATKQPAEPKAEKTPKTVRTPTQAVAEGKARQREELRDRKEAEKGSHIFLAPDDVRGEYDRSRKLVTTLGGAGKRVITDDDLRQFAHEAKRLGAKYKGGITAQQVIDMSLPERRQSAQEQIHYAIPMQSRKGLFHFVTNAGPGSKVTRHHVHVEFLNFSAAAGSPSKTNSLARQLTLGPLRFDCDCEDHRYRFRYIATVGKWAAGRAETGFPKITNPRLVGVACKHVVRVMRALSSTMVQTKIAAAIEAARSDLEGKAKTISKAEAEAMAKHQQRQIGRKATQIETSEQRKTRLAQARAIKAAAQSPAARRVPAAPKASPETKITKAQVDAARNSFARNLNILVRSGQLTKEAAAAMLKQVS